MSKNILSAMRHRWGRFLRESRHDSVAASSMRSELDREPPTLADAHLVMNSLNQLAAHLHSRTGEEDPRLFAIADYLRFVFRGGTEAWLPLDEELALLQSYLQLAGRNRSVEIPFEFSPGAEMDADAKVLVQRHLSCDLVAALMRALPGDSVRAAGLRLSFEGATAVWAYSLRAHLVLDQGRAIERRLRSEIDALAGRFGLAPGSDLVQEFTMAGDVLSWTIRVPRLEGAR